MKQYVTDTQCLIWYFADDRRLPRAISKVFDTMEDGRAQVIVPSIVLVEAIFLFQRQRIQQNIVDQLFDLPETPTANLYLTPLNKAVLIALKDFGPTAIPEMADRIIAATARSLNLPLLTTDQVIHNSSLVKVVE